MMKVTELSQKTQDALLFFFTDKRKFGELPDKNKLAAALFLNADLAFEGGKTLKSDSGRRYVCNDAGELCRIQEMCDGREWLTIARAEESIAED